MTETADEIIITRLASRVRSVAAVDKSGKVLCFLPVTDIEFSYAHPNGGKTTLLVHSSRVKFKEA